MSNNPYNQNQGYSGGQTQDDGFQKVGVGDGVKRDRWRFEDPGKHVFEGILLRKNLNVSSKFGVGNYYTVVSAQDNVEYNISGTKLLDDRMREVMAGSFIRIIYQGVHREKNYKIFDVFVNKNYQPTSMVGGQQTPVNQAPGNVYHGGNPNYTPPQPAQQYTPPPSQYPQPPVQHPQQGQYAPPATPPNQQGQYPPPGTSSQPQSPAPAPSPFPSITPFGQAQGMGTLPPQQTPPSPSSPFPNNSGVAPSGEGYTNPPF